MTDIEPEFVKVTVARTDLVTLSDASAKRVARMLQGTRRTLDGMASRSMFDTEPAQFVRTLETLAQESRRNG